MEKVVICLEIFLMFVLVAGFAIAEPSIDISGLKSSEYSIGSDLTFRVVLVENGAPIEGDVEVVVRDALGKKEIMKTIQSNKDVTIKIESDFPGGLWSVSASYGELDVPERPFTVSENAQVEFSIEGDELTIKNNGNVRYTKTVQIKIGTETNSYVQNIGVGDEKRLKLISPEGFYDIEVTDGKTSIKRQKVQLFGTGNVIGAVDTDLVGYTGFAGVVDPTSPEDQLVSLGRLPIALVFVGAVIILGALVLVERKISKKKKNMG